MYLVFSVKDMESHIFRVNGKNCHQCVMMDKDGNGAGIWTFSHLAIGSIEVSRDIMKMVGRHTRLSSVSSLKDTIHVI